MVEHMVVDAAAVELYGLAPEQFTAARNALAKAATEGGDAQAGGTIKALRKPTLAAWLANQLVRADPDGVNDLTELGEQLRQAHVSGDGAQLRRLTPRRHNLVQQLVKTARGQAQEQGHPVSEQIAQRLTETHAALVDPGAAQLLRTGQLTSALRHVGFGVVDETGEPAQLAPVRPRVVRSTRPKPPAKRSTKPTRKTATVDTTLQRRRAELESRAHEAETDYAAAEAEQVEAEAQLDAHDHLIADLNAAIQRLNEELEQARQQLRDASRRTKRLRVARDRAARNVALAQRRRDANQQRLANLDN
jgi:flagellar biosynthesis chaperone FliJ